jgi:hypothetical protein
MEIAWARRKALVLRLGHSVAVRLVSSRTHKKRPTHLLVVERTLRGQVKRGAILLVAAFLLSACGLTHPQALAFRVDDRLHFVSPQSRSLVGQPVNLAWTMRDFKLAAPGSERPSRGAGYFAIFVDQPPIQPGQTMRALAKNDELCRRIPSCPDTEYLQEHEIFMTTDTRLTLPRLHNRPNNKQEIQSHTITVILMDTGGHRIGEQAWQLDVRSRRLGR